MPLFVVAVSLFAATLPSMGSQDCPHWEDIVKSEGFQRYVFAATKSARLDIGVRKSFEVDDVHDLKTFLLQYPISLRMFTRESGFCPDPSCMKVRDDSRVVLLVICRSSNWTLMANFFANPYVSYLCAVAADYGNVTSLLAVEHVFRGYYVSRIRGSGMFNFTVSGGRLLVTENSQQQRLHFSEVPEALLPYRRNLPLSGVEVKVWCLYPYVCEDPAFRILGDLVRHKNASFRALELAKNGTQLYVAYAETLLDPSAMLYFPSVLIVGIMIPGTTVPCYYSNSGFSFFVPGLKPYSKEAVLLLPFNASVWLVFLFCLAACLLIVLLIRKVLGVSRDSCPIHPFVVTLLHQSWTVSSRTKVCQSFRVLLGVWIITTFVVTVAFRSNLTSLLNNVPLQGRIIDFTSLGELKSRGLRMNVLSYAEEIVLAGNHAGSELTLGDACFDSAGRVRIADDGRDIFLVYGSGSRAHEMLKTELVSRGYVQTQTTVFAYPGGPEIRTTSPYRRAIGKLLSQSFEDGLFLRAVDKAVFEFTSYQESEKNVPSAVQEPLGMDSLLPYFFPWAFGVTISSVTFIAEYLFHRYHV